MKPFGSRIHQWWTLQLSASARKRITGGLRAGFLIGVLGYLAYQLTHIGWSNVASALPTTPWFYVLFLLIYASLPVAETLLYGFLWKQKRPWSGLPVFIKKRVFNKDVLGYSGEVYLFAWARRQVGLPEREIAKTIRDTNILSSAASTVVAVLLLGLFLTAGHLSVHDLLGATTWTYLVGGALGGLVLVAVGLRFRRYLFAMPFRTAALVFGIYCGRLLLGQVLQITQWAVVMPDVAIEVWFTFAALSLVITRLPFVPSQDLIFLGAGLELSGMMAVPQAELAAMLLMASVLDKLLNAFLFGLLTLLERRKPLPVHA